MLFRLVFPFHGSVFKTCSALGLRGELPALLVPRAARGDIGIVALLSTDLFVSLLSFEKFLLDATTTLVFWRIR